MKNLLDISIHRYRLCDEQVLKHYGSYGDEATGVFTVPSCVDHRPLLAIATADQGWEHVSVSRPNNRTPTWAEMDQIKRLFWDDEEPVMQLHPPRSTWVSYHPYCLHLWKPMDAAIPLPPPIFVGPISSSQ
jgi:hypothetical protein